MDIHLTCNVSEATIQEFFLWSAVLGICLWFGVLAWVAGETKQKD